MFEKLNPTDRLDDIMGDLDSAISAAKIWEAEEESSCSVDRIFD